MNLKECFDALGWTYSEKEGGYNNIQCACGGEMDFSGYFGTEVIECKSCQKYMVDLFSPIRTGNATCTVLKPSEYEMDENRHWIAIDGAGGILVEQEAQHG